MEYSITTEYAAAELAKAKRRLADGFEADQARIDPDMLALFGGDEPAQWLADRQRDIAIGEALLAKCNAAGGVLVIDKHHV